MGTMELEVKVLDINEKEFRKKLESLGAILKEDTKQILYTYDLNTIYGRFIDILTQLNTYKMGIKYDTALKRLELLFFDLDNMIDDKEKVRKLIGVDCFTDILKNSDLMTLLNKKEIKEFMNNYVNNDKKWIRVRETNGKVTIAVKHILAPNNTNLQQMQETEINVESIKDANNLLEALGFSYKSFQEKKRVSYILNDHEIDIDSWPGIPTYFEVEGTSEEDLIQILEILGYKIEDTVSCTADQVYEKYGKSMFDKRELTFEE